MSIANYTLPDYLKPMSVAEGTALDLRRQEQIGEQAARWSSMQNQQQESQIRQQEFMRQNLDRMQRRAAMARMMGDAAANEASGMDSYEAKETAFLKAAPDLFKDSPEVYQAVTEKAYTGLQRRLGWKKYSTRLTELTAENAQLPPDEQRSFDEISQQALDENMGQLDPTGAATASMLRAAQAGRYSLARTQIQQQGATKRAELSHADRVAALEESKKRSESILKEKAREFDTGLVAKQEQAAQTEEGKDIRLQKAEKAKDARDKANRMLKAQKDPELTKINEELAKAKAYRADVLASPHWWKSKPETITKAINQLESDRAKRLKELGIEDEGAVPIEVAPAAPTATVAPAKKQLRLGTLVKQNGKTYHYIGGDVDDPLSYAEVLGK